MQKQENLFVFVVSSRQHPAQSNQLFHTRYEKKRMKII